MTNAYDSLFTYDGQPLFSGLANGNTFRIIRQRTAQELGPFLASTASSGSNGSVLVDNSWPVNSGLNVDDLYTDQYLFRPDAALTSDKVRIVKTYIPLIGQLIPDQAWTNAPVEGEAYEVHGIIDPWTELPVLINQALIRIMVVAEFSFSPIKDQNRHSLATAAPWLINPRWVRSVGYLNQGPLSTPTTLSSNSIAGTKTAQVASVSNALVGYTAIFANGSSDGTDLYTVITGINGTTLTVTDDFAINLPTGTVVRFQLISEDRNQVDPFMRSVRGKAIGMATQIGTVTYLEHPGQVFDPATTTLFVRAIAPAYYFCGGVSYPQYGLTLDTDTAPCPADWVAAMTLNEAWRHYAHLLDPIANQRLIRDRQEAGAWLTDLSAKYFQNPPMEFRPLNHWGAWPRHSGAQVWGP